MRSMVEGGVGIRNRCVSRRSPSTVLRTVPLPVNGEDC